MDGTADGMPMEAVMDVMAGMLTMLWVWSDGGDSSPRDSKSLPSFSSSSSFDRTA